LRESFFITVSTTREIEVKMTALLKQAELFCHTSASFCKRWPVYKRERLAFVKRSDTIKVIMLYKKSTVLIAEVLEALSLGLRIDDSLIFEVALAEK